METGERFVLKRRRVELLQVAHAAARQLDQAPRLGAGLGRPGMFDRAYVVHLDHRVACSHAILLPHHFRPVERQGIGIIGRAFDQGFPQGVEKLE